MKSKFWKFSGSALLALAITAFPALSHADTISTGDFISGTASTATPMAGSVVTVKITGTLGTMTLVTGPLSELVPSMFFMFTGGTIDITTPAGTFMDTLLFGSLSTAGTGSFALTGFLTPNAQLTTGSATLNYTIVEGAVVGGTGGVNFTGHLTFIPEPGTLGLMGTGLIGLAGLLKRKLLS